ncbi:NAD(P)/FAD-dependent oxidoreductase [Facklamia miroungae]|uniref:Glycine/D-amino acid oxidase n=1 Tax=Facklamia miroungae TaxID=120956 RepID=A0A1G7SND1_9LACT|nr:FAD-binding oxidoreductase [Facklamia miroungae]NKZ29609.1 FAD-binding oxidoreductase [Facklamia miroungae]SDG23939.1 Glycine/D-amino acid oxidase [Facklamia miroungae]
MKNHVPYIIVGGGIVGSTAAYYLSRSGHPVILFDKQVGQASRAAAGIICPWFSKRRNKKWYYLVSKGAEFYRQFMNDLTADGYDTSNLFQETGTIILRKNSKDLQKDLENALLKQEASPSIGIVSSLTSEAIKEKFPLIDSPWPGSFISGGGRVNGQALVDLLHKAIQHKGGKVIKEAVQLYQEKENFQLKTPKGYYTSDQILLAAGPAVKDLTRSIGLDCDLHPQKGQLLSLFHQQWMNNNWPGIMSPGGIDILPFRNGELMIGASHEDDKGSDLRIDPLVIKELKEKALQILPDTFNYPLHQIKVGTRAFTTSGDVLIGPVPNNSKLWTISGLGSSGLTSGPYLAYQWYRKVVDGNWEIPDNLISSHSLIH